MNQSDNASSSINRSRLFDISLILLGVLALVVRGRINIGLVQAYGGNIVASFSMFFLFKFPLIPAKFQAAIAAALALLVAALFEATNTFRFEN